MDEANDLLDEAFATGATSISVRRWIDGKYHAEVTAFVMHSEGKRSACSSASAEGEGTTPSEALRDALAQLPPHENAEVTDGTAIAIAESPREVLEPEVLDPKLRYAIVGRPGQFVTREEARGQR